MTLVHTPEHLPEGDASYAGDPKAEKPTPGRDGKDVLLRTFKEIGEDRVTLIAAGVTYFLLLAIFPTLSAFVSIYGIFAETSTVSKSITALSAVVPAGGLEIVSDQLTRLTSQGTPTLGLTLFISLAMALWSSSAGVKSLFEAMNVAYGEHEKRNFLVLNAVAIVFTLIGVIGAAVMFAVVVGLPVALSMVGLGKGTEILVQIAGYVLLAGALFVGIAALYRFGPSPHGAKWRWITPGAVLAVVIIGVVSALFSWYASNFGHFDKTYGSLGALIGFLFWMWVSITAVVLGAELNSELERPENKGAPPPPLKNLAVYKPSDPRKGRSRDWVEGFDAASRASTQKQAAMVRHTVPIALAVAGIVWLTDARHRDGR